MTVSPDNHHTTALVTQVDHITDDIRVLHLKPETSVSWDAGQHIDVSFADLPAHPYSIASAPGTDIIEIHVKRGKGAASNYIMDQLKTGDMAAISPPEGHNIYNETIRGPVLAIAGGLGISPIKAITAQALATGRNDPFLLYWGTKDENERYLDDFFQDLALQYSCLKFVPVTGDDVTDVIEKNFQDFSSYQIYVSGPAAMITATLPILLDKGAQHEKISYDRHPEADNVKL